MHDVQAQDTGWRAADSFDSLPCTASQRTKLRPKPSARTTLGQCRRILRQGDWHLQKKRVIEHNLRRCNAQIQDRVVNGACGLDGAQALLQVGVERPELCAAVEAALHVSPATVCRALQPSRNAGRWRY